MTDDELIAALRAWAPHLGKDKHWVGQAADRLAALAGELADRDATIARIRAALNFVPPMDDTERNRAIAKDLADGMSLRTISRRYTIGVGIVRGVARAALSGDADSPPVTLGPDNDASGDRSEGSIPPG